MTIALKIFLQKSTKKNTKRNLTQQELNIFAASMQRQFMSDIQTNLGEIAKEKEVGIVMVKEAVPNGGIDVTDELIAKLQ